MEITGDKLTAGARKLIKEETLAANLILQPLNIPVSTRYGHTRVILMPSFSEAFSSWLSDSWNPMAPNLLAQ